MRNGGRIYRTTLTLLNAALRKFGLSNLVITMDCPPARGDNPRALASGLSNLHVDKHGISIFRGGSGMLCKGVQTNDGGVDFLILLENLFFF